MGSATLADIERLGEVFAASHGVDADDPEALSKLRGLSAAVIAGDLNLLSMTSHRPFTFAGPFVDGTIVVDSGEAYSEGAFDRIPVIVGATSDDFEGRTGFMVGGARRFVGKLAAMGVPVYQYRFSYVAEHFQSAGGAKHATDIPFFFGTQRLKYGEHTTPTDDRVGAFMSGYLTQFARIGDPNGSGLPAWPRCDGGPDGIFMDFSAMGSGVAQIDPWGPEIDRAAEPTYPDFVTGAGVRDLAAMSGSSGG